MQDPLVWAIIFFIVAAILIGIEIFVPSSGLLTIAAGLAALTAIVFLWQVSAVAAMSAIVIIAVSVWIGAWILMKHFNDLPLTRRMVLNTHQSAVARVDTRQSLVGCEGMTLTDLRPVGTCLINDERIECVAEHGVILRNTPVRVTRVSGLETKVRAVEVGR